MGLTSFPKLLVKPFPGNQDLNLHRGLSVLDSVLQSLQLWLLMGLKRTLNIFLVAKAIAHWRWGIGKNSNIHWNGPGQPGLPKKTGVQWLLEQVWGGESKLCLGPCDAFPCSACGCQTGEWGLAGSQRNPLGATFHSFGWQLFIETLPGIRLRAWPVLVQPEVLSSKFVESPKDFRKLSLVDCCNQRVVFAGRRNSFKQAPLKQRRAGEQFSRI